LKARRNQNSPYNFVPRDGGKFYWHQVYNAVSAGADMLYVAMFDEIDEGTSMYKMVETEKELPEGRILVPLNIDGYNLPSDWYLRLGAETGKMLRGEIPLSPEFPFQETLDELMIKGQFAGANAAGEWETTDAEGSLETMTIQQLSDNEFFVELFDNESKACGTGGNGDPIPVRAEGIGESRGNAIFITEFAITCLGDPEWLLATVSNTLTYNPATESLIDSWDSIWTRVK
jgi:hypothetical protein